MELVPILSTIVLIGTIATFILAIFAYILFKVRERRARKTEPQRRVLKMRRRRPQSFAEGPAPASTPAQPSLADVSDTGAAPDSKSPADIPTAPEAAVRSRKAVYVAPAISPPRRIPITDADDDFDDAQEGGGSSQSESRDPSDTAPQDHENSGDGSQHTAPPQQPTYQPADSVPQVQMSESRELQAFFWEYTKDGLVPVVPTRPSARSPRPPARSQGLRIAEEDDDAWL